MEAGKITATKTGSGTGLEGGGQEGQSHMGEIKAGIHRRLLERLNLSNLETVSREDAIEAIREVIQEIFNE
ncbi:MAG: hypothetical protein KJN92_01975 [Gemmatimonadetes bacterium]|nr:hypothetical protein [Gemmatimonadota bacterium]